MQIARTVLCERLLRQLLALLPRRLLDGQPTRLLYRYLLQSAPLLLEPCHLQLARCPLRDGTLLGRLGLRLGLHPGSRGGGLLLLDCFVRKQACTRRLGRLGHLLQREFCPGALLIVRLVCLSLGLCLPRRLRRACLGCPRFGGLPLGLCLSHSLGRRRLCIRLSRALREWREWRPARRTLACNRLARLAPGNALRLRPKHGRLARRRGRRDRLLTLHLERRLGLLGGGLRIRMHPR